ncbi:acid protease [Micractinium conductrix]|uniref:Acid protease n=1 Tax=Micractinium conductrix TaxID=554055 RepID=A0A2P6V145_9CHLO|nr:acid protease [Micractinium conductrix]|eukprot:PSC67812.1 acid protease [Micractinium conductrix]
MVPRRANSAAAMALVLLAVGAAGHVGTAAILVSQLAGADKAAGKRSFGFRVHEHDASLASPLVSRRRALLRNSTLPLHGAVKDFGYFYATLYLGTPAKKFAVIVDTGSTMTYVPCSSCGNGCGPNHQDAAFDPEASSTASLISCSSPKCSCGSPRCGCAQQQCTYKRSYAEESSSSGILLEDVLAMHDGQPGAPIIFGCETHETGEIYKQRADGLFGLGNSEASVVNQLVKAGIIDDVFSLCFGMVEGHGALLLGDADVPGFIPLQYTPLISSASHPFYYNVKMLSLAVDGQLLPVSQSLFDQGYGTVLDSGTTFTYMPTPVFQAFANAVETFAVSKGLKRVPGPDPQYEDICFGQAPAHQDLEALSQVFPSMEIQFDQGTSLVLGPLNYLFVHTFNSGKYCLGVFDNGRNGTLLGGITFRNVLVRYDRANKQVGFGPAPCKELGEMQHPPCTFFAAEGSGELAAAAAAAADGDCTMEPLRQQQQELYDGENDLLDQPDTDAAAEEQQQEQREKEQAAAAGGAGVHDGSGEWRRPPEEVGQAEPAKGAAAGTQDTQQQQQQQQPKEPAKPKAQPADVPAAGGKPAGGGSGGGEHASTAGPVVRPGTGGEAGGSKGGGSSNSGYSVAMGLLVAVAAVLSLGFAVVLLQPATRDRLRGVFGGGSRSYRTLQEEEGDPEGGFVTGALSPVATGGGGGGAIGALAGGAAAGGGGGAVELATGTRSEFQRGITTPTKLQRTGSASADGEEAGGGAGGGTPREASPLRGASQMR